MRPAARHRGGATRSSTRSTSAASPTATATAPATSPASASRLPYLRDLGVDAIWFTPWYASPLADGGYDVADYRAIDPAFGTLAEAEALIAEALELGIRTIVDIVPNHVSDQHPWFQAALAAGPGLARARRGSGSTRAAARTATRCPTTWASNFSGRDLDPDRRTPTARPGEWYLHLFSPEQPDLNWDHPDVRARARGHPPLLVRPRRGRRPDRLGRPAGQGPGPAGGARRARRRASTRTPTATSSTTSIASWRAVADSLPGRPRPRRRDLAAGHATGSRATCGRTSCTPPSTSTSWPGRGTPPSLRASIDTDARRPRAGRRAARPGSSPTTTSPGR